MPKIFLCPYISGLLNHGRNGCSKPFAALHEALRRNEWPYDCGDDPSFFSQRCRGGALTWGICRPDVRSSVQGGDVVVFFSFAKTDAHVEYRLCAIATVETKIRHTDIYTCAHYRRYRHYLNLLIKPVNSNGDRYWAHHEPGGPERYWHKDWLSRVAPYRGFLKSELSFKGTVQRISSDSRVGGKLFAFGDNYVIFSSKPSLTVVLEKPPVVAYAEPPRSEEWLRQPVAQAIFKRTVGLARKHGVDDRSLRLPKQQHPHSPAIRWELTTESLNQWRTEFICFVRSC